MTPALPRSLRTMCCTPTDRATALWSKFVVHAIGDGAIVEQRGIHLVHAGQQVLLAAHVEEGLLLAGEGGVRQIFGRRRGAHRDRELPAAPLAAHLAPGLENLGRAAASGKASPASSRGSARPPPRGARHRRRPASRAPRGCVRRVRPARGNRDRRARSLRIRRGPKLRGSPSRRSSRRWTRSCRRPVRRPCSFSFRKGMM
jgi:hypothetical protein